jgi:hypothetical protein
MTTIGTVPRSARGFTLLIAVILSSVILSLSLALLDIAYKQVVLSSIAKNSQYAFYAADSLLECGLYYDQQTAGFAYAGLPSDTIFCEEQTINLTTPPNSTSVNGSTRTTEFFVPCAGGGMRGQILVVKDSSGETVIYANGYNTCNESDARRIERGLRISY